MAVKAKITDEEYAASPDAVKAFYKKAEGGGFILDAEGVEDVRGLKSALEKERDGRKALDAKLKELEGKFQDLDPEAAREALAEIQKIRDQKLITEGKIEELLATRTEALRKDFNTQKAAYDKQLDALKADNGKLTGRLEEVLIDSGIQNVASAARVRASALTDVLLRGRKTWRLHEGKPTPFRDDGEVLYGKDPKAPMSMEEWIASLQADAPHLFEDSKGSGTEPNSPRATGNRLTLTRDQARDVATWRNAEREAAKTGAQIVVQD